MQTIRQRDEADEVLADQRRLKAHAQGVFETIDLDHSNSIDFHEAATAVSGLATQLGAKTLSKEDAVKLKKTVGNSMGLDDFEDHVKGILEVMAAQ